MFLVRAILVRLLTAAAMMLYAPAAAQELPIVEADPIYAAGVISSGFYFSLMVAPLGAMVN